MNKVGIVTFHDAYNYGAALQAFALKKVITDLGYDCGIVDYENPIFTRKYKKNLWDCSSLHSLITTSLLYPRESSKQRKFKRFRSKYMNLLSFKAVKSNEKYFSKFITGSDQVWNYNLTNGDRNYFLDFINDNSKKCSYAASFGVSTIPIELENQYRELLSSFSQILVREQAGANIVKKLLGHTCPVVLDPTLLLDKKVWGECFELSSKIDKKYILVYLFDTVKEDTLEFINELANSTRYKVIWIDNPLRGVKGVNYIRSASPERWVELFKNASYVVTNSFHGVAFSINFRKQFFISPLPQSSKNTQSRIDQLINTFSIGERYIVKGRTKSEMKMIDYNLVSSSLEKERVNSLNLLSDMLDAKENKKLNYK